MVERKSSKLVMGVQFSSLAPWSLGQMVKTVPFHGTVRSSILLGTTNMQV